tara:strand:+ start:427 stop:1503 length:1077 start_codon:yes stop_codon:yes gene_type:complete
MADSNTRERLAPGFSGKFAQDDARQERGVPEKPLQMGSGWRASHISEADWRVEIPAEALREFEIIAGALAEYDEPLDELNPDGFDWPATTDLMADVRSRLNDGLGFVLLDRMPVETWTDPANRAVTWLLNTMIAPPIMQKWNGHRVYDVKDTGAKLEYGVRRSVTNLSQEVHTDGSFLAMTPDFFSLTCIRQAEAGGTSLISSLVSAHNDLLENHPEHLARLYEPFWWDRQAEHDPAEQRANWLPVFTRDGNTLSARYYDDYIRKGYGLMNDEIDAAGLAALEAMREAVESPQNQIEFRLQPGQMICAQNMQIAHGRTGFRDPSVKTEGGRLLLRYWLRKEGGIALDGVPEKLPAMAD